MFLLEAEPWEAEAAAAGCSQAPLGPELCPRCRSFPCGSEPPACGLSLAPSCSRGFCPGEGG